MTNTETETRKWGACPVDIPGPRQVSAVNKAIGKLRGAGAGELTIEGTIGQPETERRMICLTGFMTRERNPLAIEKGNAIGETYGWTVSKKNANAIKKEFLAAVPVVEASRPIIDNRVTPEVAAEKAAKVAAIRAESDQKRDERESQRAETHAVVLAKRPPNATALIVAELDQDDSDSMTDYFAHKTTRTVAIGWRTGSREDFRQLRRAAAGFPQTEHLGPDAGPDVEHRENYSMGGGNYVKAGSRHCSGWKVTSHPLNEKGELGYGLHNLEDGIPATPAPVAPTDDGAPFSIIETTNKRGPFFLVIQAARVDRTTFEAQRDSAKAAGGWYSRKWGKTPGGFGFDSREAAETWARETLGGGGTPGGSGSNCDSVTTPSGEGTESNCDSVTTQPAAEFGAGAREREAERLETMADRMTEDIEYKRAPLSQNWTARRARIKDGQRADADRLEKVQQGLRAIATALRSNSLPPALAGLLTKTAIEKALSTHGNQPIKREALLHLIERSKTDDDAEAEAERAKALELEQLTDGARLRNVPGFFPTPPAVVERMLEAADVDTTAPMGIDTPRYNFLEPSAGIGSIADALRPYVEQHGGGLVLYEIAHDLCEILKAKGYDSAPGCSVRCADFLELPEHEQQGERFKFDRILMNPPFEKRADVQHVREALAQLETGGRLVALMTPRGAEVMEEEHGATVEDLPAGSFTGKDSFRQTGVSVRLVTIDKD